MPRIKDEPQAVWLVIPYDAADVGARPVPNGDPFWASTEIWITGGDAHDNPIAGQPAKVHARIWNYGNFPADPTFVHFAFCDPALGIPWTAPQPIGVAQTMVPGLSTAEVVCPNDWTPPPTGTVYSCLLVTCTTIFDPATEPNNARTDRHVGQHNVTIVHSTDRNLQFDIHAGRTMRHRGAVQVAALAALGDGDLKRAVLAAGTLQRTLQIQTREMSRQQAQLFSRRALILHDLDRETRYEILQSAHVSELLQIDINADPAQEPAFVPEADEGLRAFTNLGGPVTIDALSTRRAKVTLTVPDGDRSLIVHLCQFEDNVVTGGYTVIVTPRNGI